jgi:hypothetical protein
MDNVSDFEELLKIYEAIPKNKYEPSYLDICDYSGRRFEEICSRILAFYFQPKNEHSFGTLFIDSLFEVLGNNDNNYSDTNIDVRTEEYAEGNRIDIFILSKLWAIGIENKVGASLYNPLEIYKKRIEKENKPKNFKIVLTLYEIQNKEEMNKIKDNDFVIVLYTDLFKIIKNRIGNFIKDGNTKYLVFLYDFIQTLEHMREGNIMSSDLDRFFSDNKDLLDNLVTLYGDFIRKKAEKVTNKLVEIQNKIIDKTHDTGWGISNGWVLTFSKNNCGIGTESWFVEENNDQTAFLQITLTSWTHKYWDQYREQLIKLYPDLKERKDGTRHFLDFEKIKGNEEEKIISKLKECYDCIINLK